MVANMCGLKIVLQLIMVMMASQLTILITSSSLTVMLMTLMGLPTIKALQIQMVLKLMMALKRMAGELLQPKNCRGFEVKAHSRAPAARNVNLINCYSENDIRSFDFRHVGFHLATEKISTSAFDINVVNCTAKYPIYNDLYTGLNPRALVISAYRNVNVSNFNAIGDPAYDYKNTPIITTQYKSRNINLNNISVSGFTTASNDIYVIGGAQKSDNVNISNVTIHQSALVGIAVGSRVDSVNINNVNLTGTNKAGSIGVYCTNSQANISAAMCEQYATPSKIAGKTYTFIPNNFKGGLRGATTSGYAKTNTSAVLASSGEPQALGDATLVGATTGGCVAKEQEPTFSDHQGKLCRWIS